MLREMLEARALPPIKPRGEMLDALCNGEYGYAPPAPKSVKARLENANARAFAGKATQSRLTLSFDTPRGAFEFPLTTIVPNTPLAHPAFVYINFRPDIPDIYLPAEEIIDHGYAVATFCYKDVTSDSAEGDGLARMYAASWGKIGMWAFAASRVMDYLATRSDIDIKRVAVSGHSRLGKTALWCGASDERFSLAISNDSGCGGAALHRGKTGERISDMARVFPFWFCEKYSKFADREAELEFDQHYLIALMAPRACYVASAQDDAWADPTGEFLSCLAASPAWGSEGGLTLSADELPALNMGLHAGEIGYHLRAGAHYHSRADWLYQIAYRDIRRV